MAKIINENTLLVPAIEAQRTRKAGGSVGPAELRATEVVIAAADPEAVVVKTVARVTDGVPTYGASEVN